MLIKLEFTSVICNDRQVGSKLVHQASRDSSFPSLIPCLSPHFISTGSRSSSFRNQISFMSVDLGPNSLLSSALALLLRHKFDGQQIRLLSRQWRMT